ncbi:hypothetical protein [Lacrimispora saccharolytica]|uniref:Uncharacterized protein n=1 Tax=Lacrimispora saccharolytica (strain ATCC 35040 / DSM 2544 / NRCC 2533 / WM1) TaxID=610130 RepID=D9R929_LACSW|nr:hypothetical protein [Lacrimispora saccharolytica]ADL04004.1 hypothetical protein Closa_1403 [[Clostridium] saccharolyticum WM1]QRV21694.1 hypothetical protein I6K70_09755 [Lacrimispora saccharolytica]
MNLAHFALQKLHILPGALQAMSNREKAFVYASIQLRVEEEKREIARIKK